MADDEKTCPKCAETVKAAATVCKHCGYNFADPRGTAPADTAKPKGSLGRNVGIGCIGLVALVAIIGMFSGGGGGKSASNSADPAAAPVEAMKVSVSELARAYAANEAAAQQTYGDKVLEVSGVIHTIDLDISDKPYLVLDAAGSFLGAQMHLTEASQAKASGLAKGQRVTAICQKVSEVVGTPMLDDCELQ